ncbi:MAG: tyrosine-type recombinase/integrase [Clostridia bacterium]|nr:tyrosine-type recombinase/integrase [Clostridia bacterium]
MNEITKRTIEDYKNYLIEEEKCSVTIEKYIRDITAFVNWTEGNEVTKTLVLEYKNMLTQQYAPASVNSVLSSLNGYFNYIERYDLKVKNLKVQRQIFCQSEKELTKAEYERLLKAAKSKKNERLYLIMQTICATGIRVSELSYITTDAVNCGHAQVKLKGKIRMIILPRELCQLLKKYIKEKHITSGSVFVTRKGQPVDRHSIWKSMKQLCECAGVSKEKVFPHNLRHLFARTYYSLQKDIVRLADILGHSNVNTTRIYTIEDGSTHRRQMQRMGLVRMQN